MGTDISNSGVLGMRTVRLWLVAVLLVCNLMTIPLSYAGLTTEFLAFPTVTGAHRSQAPVVHGVDREDFIPAVDLFFTADYEEFRVLAELFLEVNGAHGVHLERFQVGWLPEPDLAVWLGRFHNPIGFWNTAYHHGSYLQTSISRPSIVEFEHDGGILPIHVSGLFVEKTVNTAGSSWQYAFSLGAGPYFKKHLEAVELFRSEENSVKLLSSLRLSWHPVGAENNQLGLFIGSAAIPGVASKFEELKQLVRGVYADWNFQSVRMTSALYSINSDVKQSGIRTEGSFINNYLQLEAPLNADWTPYGRLERSFGDQDDPFLNYADAFIRDRSLIGVRYDFTHNQTLKLELSRVDFSSSNYNQVTLQWSAVFP